MARLTALAFKPPRAPSHKAGARSPACAQGGSDSTQCRTHGRETLVFCASIGNTGKQETIHLGVPFSDTHVAQAQVSQAGWFQEFRNLSMAAKAPAEVKPLHILWEEDPEIRQRVRDQKALLEWTKPELIGVPCMANVGVNWRPLAVLAKFHCNTGDAKRKAPSVKMLKKQAM